jgi:hypothetical protein
MNSGGHAAVSALLCSLALPRSPLARLIESTALRNSVTAISAGNALFYAALFSLRILAGTSITSCFVSCAATGLGSKMVGAAVVLEVQPELVALIAKIEGAAHVIARGEKLIPFDFHCPLMSLPFACKTKMTSIPADVPYLKISETQASNWAKRLRTKKPLVGVAWAGQRSHNNDVNRSMGLSSFAPLFDLADVQFVSLQHDPSTNDRGLLRSHCNVLDVDKDLRSLVDTAALISQLDCVISVDTAVAHLAGALAKPTIVLLPFAADFRWLCGRDDSPWYPTARLFRQSQFGRWENVIEQVRAHLVNL